MKSIDDLKAKIQSFEIVGQTIADELAIMSEQLSQIELQEKNETELKKNPFLSEKQTKNIATFFYNKGYIITECNSQKPSIFPMNSPKNFGNVPNWFLNIFLQYFETYFETWAMVINLNSLSIR